MTTKKQAKAFWRKIEDYGASCEAMAKVNNTSWPFNYPQSLVKEEFIKDFNLMLAEFVKVTGWRPVASTTEQHVWEFKKEEIA